MGRRSLLLMASLATLVVLAFVWSLSQETETKTSLQPFGGPFTLTDHTGDAFSLSSVSGSYVLIFFGFTHCPDACPLGLKKISDALALLPDASSSRLVPLFITVDPARDTPEVLAAYLNSFSPKIIGLTGTQAQIADVTKRYAIYAEKVSLNTPPAGPDAHHEHGQAHHGSNQTDTDYSVDHTTHFILLDPQGNFLKVYSTDQTAEDLARDLTLVMGR
jgi:protein SCO1/2